MAKATIYDMVTERICQILEQGEIPWRKPWVTSERQIPMNLKTRKEYRGINIFLLASCGFSSRHRCGFAKRSQVGRGGGMQLIAKILRQIFLLQFLRDKRNSRKIVSRRISAR